MLVSVWGRSSPRYTPIPERRKKDWGNLEWWPGGYKWWSTRHPERCKLTDLLKSWARWDKVMKQRQSRFSIWSNAASEMGPRSDFKEKQTFIMVSSKDNQTFQSIKKIWISFLLLLQRRHSIHIWSGAQCYKEILDAPIFSPSDGFSVATANH